MTDKEITFETIDERFEELSVDIGDFTDLRLYDYAIFKQTVTEYDPNGKKDDTQSIDLHLLSFNKMQVTVKNKMANEYRLIVEKYREWMSDVLDIFGDIPIMKTPMTNQQGKRLKEMTKTTNTKMNDSFEIMSDELTEIDMILDKKAPRSVM